VDGKKMYIEDRHDLVSSYNCRVINWKGVRWVGQLTNREEKRNVCRILVEKSEGK
jgi:hypothetical protein